MASMGSRGMHLKSRLVTFTKKVHLTQGHRESDDRSLMAESSAVKFEPKWASLPPNNSVRITSTRHAPTVYRSTGSLTISDNRRHSMSLSSLVTNITAGTQSTAIAFGRQLPLAQQTHSSAASSVPSRSAEENRRLKDQLKCGICHMAPVCIVLLPCEHLACCEACAPGLVSCPKCGNSFRAEIKIVLGS